MTREQERDELHRAIWQIANNLREGVNGWNFKSYVCGILLSRFSPTGDLMKKKEIVLEKLKAYFDRFFDISAEK
ncbi:hypothetical protein [Chryseobacterium turcicum]|uniref:Uncharacterized protein n=1 Tax=Chryseobacterium turcicum TaxID=2898076 RepID=A0A9Q3YY63_9FLAO|nr:hypothetical protein [Chryseobacterium turcicum]MCD1118107.1 hypothetical protein [Chryseobacterium turcicum]